MQHTAELRNNPAVEPQVIARSIYLLILYVRSVQQQDMVVPTTSNNRAAANKSTSRAYIQCATSIHRYCARSSLFLCSQPNQPYLFSSMSTLTCSSSSCFPLPPPPPCLPAPCLCSCSSSSWRGMFSCCCCCAGCSRERLLLLCELVVVDVKAVETMLWAVRGVGSACFFGGGCLYRVFRRGGKTSHSAVLVTD